MPQAVRVYSSVEEDRFRGFLAQLLAQPLAAETVPSSAIITPLVLGTDPDSASPAILRAGGSALFHDVVQSMAVDSGSFTRATDRGSFEGNGIRFAIPGTDESNSGSILYKIFDTTALVVVGAGTSGANRMVRIYDLLGVGTAAVVGNVLTVGGTTVIGTDPGSGPAGAAILRTGGSITLGGSSATTKDVGFLDTTSGKLWEWSHRGSGENNDFDLYYWNGSAWTLNTSFKTTGEVDLTTGPLIVGSSNTDAPSNISIGNGGGAPTVGRGVELSLNTPSSGSFLGYAETTYYRNSVPVWQHGIDSAVAGAKLNNTDFYWYAYGATSDYVMALTQAGELNLKNGPVVIGTDPGTPVVGGQGLLRIGGGFVTRQRSIMLTDGVTASAGFWLGLDGGAQVFVGQNGLTNASPVGIWHGSAWRLQVSNTGIVSINGPTGGSTAIVTIVDSSTGGTLSLGSDGSGQTHVTWGSSGSIDGQGGELQVNTTLAFDVLISTASKAKWDSTGGNYAGNHAVGEFDNGSEAVNFTIDWNKGNVQKVTLGATPLTITFSNPKSGGVYTLIVAQDATGSRTVVWPAAVVWPGGTTPTLTTTANHIDMFTFLYDSATTKYRGVTSALNYAS